MKQVVVAGVSLFAVLGCSSGSAGGLSPSARPSSSFVEGTTPGPKFSITVKSAVQRRSVEVSNGKEIFPQDAHYYVVASLEIDNHDDEAISLGWPRLKVKTENG